MNCVLIALFKWQTLELSHKHSKVIFNLSAVNIYTFISLICPQLE